MPIPVSPKPVMIGLGLIALAAGGWAMARDEGASDSQTTDDAYVGADFSTVAPKVSGIIAQVLVADNQSVRQGQLLAVIDDRDYRVALQASEADLASAQAKADELRRDLSRQSSLIAQAGASVEADLAAISLSQANDRRYRDLASDGSGSQQEEQEAAARLAVDRAARRRDSAGHDAIRSQLPVLQARLADAQAAVARARAAVEAARLNLSYTQVRAPVDGVIGQRGVRIGNYVAIGAPLLAVVPVAQAYVEAHFRETQLARIRPGQAASVAVDAVPGLVLKGHVESIAPATGTSFGTVAPENATGNFTKITQRLAVRIALDLNQPDAGRLHVGMSVVPTVRIAG